MLNSALSKNKIKQNWQLQKNRTALFCVNRLTRMRRPSIDIYIQCNVIFWMTASGMHVCDIIHLLYDCEGNMKFYSSMKNHISRGKICFFIRYKSSYFRHNYAKKYMILLCKHTKIVLNPDSLNNTGASRGFTVQYRNVRVLGKCFKKTNQYYNLWYVIFFKLWPPRLILEP